MPRIDLLSLFVPFLVLLGRLPLNGAKEGPGMDPDGGAPPPDDTGIEAAVFGPDRIG